MIAGHTMPLFKFITLALFLSCFVYGAKISYGTWEKGKTFSDYLELNQIPREIMASISEEDKKFLADIQSSFSYYELKDEKGMLLQALIPISKVMQIHLFKKNSGNAYGFDIIPIMYKSHTYYANVTIKENPYTDTLAVTNQSKVAERLSRALKGVVDTKKLSKGDELAFIYTQKSRLDKRYLMPNIKVVRVKTEDKEQLIYVDGEGYGYEGIEETKTGDVLGKKRVNYTRDVTTGSKGDWFGMPLRHVRVTSHFSYRRWHPILRRYRPHHGTDFGARRGTPLLAVNHGKVIFAGWMRGYGKVVKIRHERGYVSLYAHQSRIRVKRGQYVKRGQIIGYVGSTGRSTGPHLHLGLSRYGKWVNPMKVLRRKAPIVSVKKWFSRDERIVLKKGRENREKLEAYLKNDMPSYIWSETTSESVKRYDKVMR